MNGERPSRAPATRYAVGDAALRALRIVRLLQRDWCSVRQLADRHHVDDKTIRRDLAVIRRAGFRLLMRVEDHGRRVYRIPPTHKKMSDA